MKLWKILLAVFSLLFILTACDSGGGHSSSPCDGVTCSDHGTCDATSGTAVCNCNDGYHEDGQLNCIEDVDLCEGVNCEDWEHCVNGGCVVNTGMCNKDSDCSSNDCDTDTHTCVGGSDSCYNVTCSGHGTCVSDGYGYNASVSCNCDDGYHADGLNCIPDGEPNPCENITCSGHGTCKVDESSNAYCDCEDGYEASGLSCNVYVDPCEGVECDEWESCSEGSCILKDGRCNEKTDCESSEACDIDHTCVNDVCNSVDCGNGGVCSIESGNAVCNCANGYFPYETSCLAIDASKKPTWIGVQDPKIFAAAEGDAPITIYGQIYFPPETSDGNHTLPSGWKAQLGYKKTSEGTEYPIIVSTWTWINATFNTATSGGDYGNNDEFMAEFPTTNSGIYSYIYRFSFDNGTSWWYADASPNFISAAGYTAGSGTIQELCGTEVCDDWEYCKDDTSCEVKSGMCDTTDDCNAGEECSASHECIASDIELILKNYSKTNSGYAFNVEYIGDSTINIASSKITLNGVDVTDDITYDSTTKTFSVTESALTPNKYSYLFTLKDASGKLVEPLFVPIWIGEGSNGVKYADFGWRDAFIYQLMTDRFLNGDSSNDIGDLAGITLDSEQWQGGDFAGIIQKLDENYFTNMGVNAIWISSPILNPHTTSAGGVDPNDTRSYTSYHAYHPVASGYSFTNEYGYTSSNGPIDSAFGTPEELRELIAKAHAKGIRVIPDFVANHVHSNAPLYQQHTNWFYAYNPCNNNWDSHRIDCWFTTYMPDFDYADNPEARKAMINHAIWLVQEYNFDGFRADALKHMSDIFVKELKSAVVSKIETTVTNHDLPDEAEVFYMVGESLGGWARYHTRADMVQGQVNEEFYYNARDKILKATDSMSNLASFTIGNDTTFLTEMSTNGGAGGYPGAVMGNFFGNHDQDRALTEAGGNYARLRIAQTYLMTAPINVPMLYQGDDIGMYGYASDGYDSGRRAVMKFTGLSTEEQTSLDHAKKLGKFRATHEALRYGTRTTCSATTDAWIYKLTYNNKTVIVGLNRGNSSYTGNCSGVSGTFTDLDGSSVSVSGSVTVPASSSVVMGN